MSVCPRGRPKPEMTWHPRDIVEFAGIKSDVNSMRSVERKNCKVSVSLETGEQVRLSQFCFNDFSTEP